jgi:hypothetical protein
MGQCLGFSLEHVLFFPSPQSCCIRFFKQSIFFSARAAVEQGYALLEASASAFAGFP